MIIGKCKIDIKLVDLRVKLKLFFRELFLEKVLMLMFVFWVGWKSV